MRYFALVLVVSSLLWGCGLWRGETYTPTTPDTTVSTTSEAATAPTPQSGYDSSSFVMDVTIPDNMEVEPGKKFIKTWRLRNNGTTTWKNYKLVFTDGDLLGAPQSVSVKNTPPGREVDISVPMQAPLTPGYYTGYWQMANDRGELFGVNIWVMIRVK